MAKVKMNVAGLIGIVCYGVELEIPDEIISQGDTAMLAWANKNISYVDAASMGCDHETTFFKSFDQLTKNQ